MSGPEGARWAIKKVLGRSSRLLECGLSACTSGAAARLLPN